MPVVLCSFLNTETLLLIDVIVAIVSIVSIVTIVSIVHYSCYSHYSFYSYYSLFLNYKPLPSSDNEGRGFIFF